MITASNVEIILRKSVVGCLYLGFRWEVGIVAYGQLYDACMQSSSLNSRVRESSAFNIAIYSGSALFSTNIIQHL